MIKGDYDSTDEIVRAIVKSINEANEIIQTSFSDEEKEKTFREILYKEFYLINFGQHPTSDEADNFKERTEEVIRFLGLSDLTDEMVRKIVKSINQ